VPRIGQLLKNHVQAHRLFQSGWARQQGVSRQAIARYLKQPTMRVDTLFVICQTLKYNFLRDIANLLPPQLQPQAPANEQTTITALQATGSATANPGGHA
jgi:hypothetical protein